MASHSSADTAVIHTNLKCVPVLTAGCVTPAALFTWEGGCRQYFCHKNVAKSKQVAFASGGLQDPCIMDWWMTEGDELEKLSFAEFMARFRLHWLPPNWSDAIVTSIFASR